MIRMNNHLKYNRDSWSSTRSDIKDYLRKGDTVQE
jgi:hypothetical protein